MPGKDDNVSNHIVYYEEDEYILERQDMEKNYIDLINKSLDIRNCIGDMMSERIFQDGLLRSELSSFLRKVRFSEQEFPAGIPIFNIKYHYLGL